MISLLFINLTMGLLVVAVLISLGIFTLNMIVYALGLLMIMILITHLHYYCRIIIVIIVVIVLLAIILLLIICYYGLSPTHCDV